MTDKRDVQHRLDEAASACAKDGAQLTELRRAVLSLVFEADGPLTAYQLLDRLKEIRRNAVPATIYRTLEFLQAQRLIHRIEKLNAFIPCMEADHHHHHAAQFLICRKCGTVAEIEDHAVLHALEQAAKCKGFRPGNAVIEVDGICAICSAL
jgi:Fur family zinc uptake transcriptional regulator